ncbi:MAG TPA: hypothetical protein DCP28_27915, partial [Cytophagales bacterium]|nr:hypothetical protein [Cytophagales bacterium]
AHRMLGDLYERTKQTEFALAEYRHAIRLYTLQTDSSGLADLFNSLGHFYEKETQYDSALYYQGRALALQHKAQNITGLAATHDDVGSIFEDLEQFDTALYHFRQARFFNQQARYWEGAIINLNNLGDVYRKTGRPAEGLAYTLRALEEARTHGLKYQLRSAYRDLAKSHFEQADYATAYAYQDSAYNLNAEIYSGEIAQQIGQTQALYEVGQKEQQIALLEKDQALSLTRQRALLGGAIALALVGGLVVMQFRSRSRKSRQLYMTERELREAEKANTELREEQLQQELDAKSKSLTTSALHIIQKNEFLEDLRQELKQIRKGEPEEMAKKLKGLSKSIDFNFNLDKDWSEFETVFQQVHQAFFDALNRQYPDLSATEVRLCAMIRLNLNSKDISSIMGIAQDSLRIARYRLRKKMGLEKGANLYAYIQTLE